MGKTDETVSYWIGTTPAAGYPALTSEDRADVVVVGGGITGILTAYELAHCGKSVVLLEAGELAHGATGRSMAKVTYAHGFDYHKIAATYDEHEALLYAQANTVGFERIAALIEQHHIDCDYTEDSNYSFVADESRMDSARREFDTMRKADLPVSWEDTAPVPFTYLGGIRLAQQARFHPRKFALAMARVCAAAGVRIYEHTPVQRVFEGETCEVQAVGDIVVKAENVVLATALPTLEVYPYEHAYSSFLDLVGRDVGRREKPYDFAGHFSVWRGQVVSMPTSEIKLADTYYSESANDLPGSFRDQTSGGEHVVLVGSPEVEPRDEDPFAEQERVGREFFSAGDATYRWYGEDAMTPDLLPVVGLVSEKSKHLYMAFGFCAWGMTKAAVVAASLRERICDRTTAWDELFSPQRAALQRGTVVRLAAISADSGAIYEKDGERYAVYRDETGEVYAFTSRCMHLGCQIHWSERDKEWHCPCHGSKYDKLGHVIHGPAKRDLTKKTLP